MNHDRCTWTDAARCISVVAVVVEGWFLEKLSNYFSLLSKLRNSSPAKSEDGKEVLVFEGR